MILFHVLAGLGGPISNLDDAGRTILSAYQKSNDYKDKNNQRIREEIASVIAWVAGTPIT